MSRLLRISLHKPKKGNELALFSVGAEHYIIIFFNWIYQEYGRIIDSMDQGVPRKVKIP